jgi:hypothetical protein
MKILDNLRLENGWKAHHSDLYAALGLNPLAHLPAEGLEARMIGNIKVWVAPGKPPVYWNEKTDGLSFGRRYRKSSAHRVMCKCPCGWIGSAGRLHQHVCR